MSCSVLTTRRFEKEFKRLSKKFPSLKHEFKNLINDISQTPNIGVFIGNDCYKIRLAVASKGKGKRGGMRIITHFYVTGETVYLLSIFDKSEKANIKPDELKELLSLLELGD